MTGPVACFLAMTALGCAAEPPDYDVHAVVIAAVDHFAPPLALGGGIERNSAMLPSRHWVPYLGAVGRAPRPPFAQVRLYPDAEVRERGEIDGTAPLRAIELVADTPRERERVMSDLAVAFGAAPREGCITPARESEPIRSVHYWTAAGDAGGVAVVSDWMNQPLESIDGALWSLWAWSGPFRGGETLLAPFAPEPCEATRRAAASSSSDRTSKAIDALERTFRNSVRAARAVR